MNINQLKRLFGLQAIYGLDFETFWSKDFTLSKLAQTEYITDPQFEAQIVSVRKDSWTKPRVMEMKAFRTWLKTIDWSQCGLLAHHTQIDGLIASHHFGVHPKMYFDTLSMARLCMPVTVGGSLKTVCAAFGRKSKLKSGALVETKGKRWKEFSKIEKTNLKAYAGDDIDDCWFIFEKLLPYTPTVELRLIDITMKMYCRPTVMLDKLLLENLAKSTIEHKADLMKATGKQGATRKILMSNEQFAAHLEALGVEPPMKLSKTTGEMTFAFAKTDIEFKKLLDHPDERVATAVEARLGIKSTIVETRALRLAGRADLGPQPIYLNYAGAKTLRWSGGDKANWQNMSRGSDMRKAIMAPPGHVFVIADLAQIEARINAWFAGQANIVAAFANREDVYKLAAAMIYNIHIDKVTKDQRFVGKVAVLALGYGAGWSRFAEMLRIGAFGPPLDITDSLARDIHTGWRQANPFIVASWRRANNNAKSAFMGHQRIVDGVLTYEGIEGRGFTHGPGGVCIRYDGLSVDEESGNMQYVAKFRRLHNGEVSKQMQRLYGGLLVENNTQFLARQVVAHQMVEIADSMKYWRQAMTTHDEIVGVVPIRYATKALQRVNAIMSRPPDWAKDLPLAVDAHISSRYDK